MSGQGIRRTNRDGGCAGFCAARRWSRRAVLQAFSLGAVGGDLWRPWGIGDNTAVAAADADAAGTGFGKARACIFIFAWGGPSHIDTWDPKPDAPAEVRGEFRAISTRVPGIHVAEHFPHLAQHAEKYAVIRSLSHDDPAHLSSAHHVLTGRLAPNVKSDRDPPSRQDSPHVGSALSRLRPRHGALPSFVTMPWYVSHPAAPGGKATGQNAGWLGAAHDPFLINGDPSSADFRVAQLALPDDISASRLKSRESLLKIVDRQAARLEQAAEVGDFTRAQGEAIRLVTSPTARRAFDLTAEPPEIRERYGGHIHGQCLLLARRLIEAGVQLVCVNWHNDQAPGAPFWDTHGNNFESLKNRLMPPADRGFAALLEDLDQRGMLDETIVVWAGEFGRRPQITARNAGREHWPWCYSAAMAGGGIGGGQVYGRSDAQGGYPAADPVSPADLTATIYHALGVPHNTTLLDPRQRPVLLTQGTPILGLFG